MPAPTLTDEEFLAVADLAALAAPSDAEEREALVRAHESLQGFARAITRLARATAAGSNPAGADQRSCPLREDRPGPGLPRRTVIAVAPSVGEGHLVRVPGVL